MRAVRRVSSAGRALASRTSNLAQQSACRAARIAAEKNTIQRTNLPGLPWDLRLAHEAKS